MKRIKYLIASYLLFATVLFSQSGNSAGVFVDDSGVMRWKDSNNEVSLFGVNYTTPFAYSYRAHKKLGLSLKQSIDLDVAQFVRLGFNAFRVHVWDREISDKDGNLKKNEHLELLDYLISKLAEKGIKTIITPIAWWGTGWPEPDVKAEGFSEFYPKVELVTNQTARAAQRNYLKQFLEHVNPYRKLNYKDDPSIIAMEIINEPFHPQNKTQVTEYINEMVKVIRDAGYVKPIYYNISENWSDEQAQAVVDADVQGVSFQWYPTDLVHNKILDGNYLLNVNKYLIPSENVKGLEKKTKMVYEFDAADIGASYMYPAMARSFREAGMQFATMFSYDPSQIAWSNTEYPTHFANLLYTPNKAIGLLIAGKVFQLIPRLKSFGDYPGSNKFGDFVINPKEDLSELNNDSLFYYTNSTKSLVKNLSTIKHIAGAGSSSIVNYDGTGAYFLDKLNENVWRLEVYPDVLWLDDPFVRTSLSRQIARLFWNEREIKIQLPLLGNDYYAYSLTEKNKIINASESGFQVKPGVYILAPKSVKKQSLNTHLKPVKFLEGLYIPKQDERNVYVVNKSNEYMIEGKPGKFAFKIAGENKIISAELFIKRSGWRGYAKYPLKNIGGFDYSLSDSLKTFDAGKYEFCVSVTTTDGVITFPDAIDNHPDKWDFAASKLWSTKILAAVNQFSLMNISRDRADFALPQFSRSMRYNLNYSLAPNSENELASIDIKYTDDNIIPFAIQHSVSKYFNQLGESTDNYSKVILKARSKKESDCVLKLVFITQNGKSFNAEAKINAEWREIEIPLSKFVKSEALIMPFSYPKFLPKVWNPNGLADDKLILSDVNFLQIICGKPGNGELELGFEIESVYLK